MAGFTTFNRFFPDKTTVLKAAEYYKIGLPKKALLLAATLATIGVLVGAKNWNEKNRKSLRQLRDERGLSESSLETYVNQMDLEKGFNLMGSYMHTLNPFVSGIEKRKEKIGERFYNFENRSVFALWRKRLLLQGGRSGYESVVCGDGGEALFRISSVHSRRNDADQSLHLWPVY
jgi:hypothetical protein